MNTTAPVAEQFGQALAKEDYPGAHALLSRELRQTYSPDALKQRVTRMTTYAPGPIREVELMEAVDDWPAKRDGDVAWVYVALTGDSFTEAVTLVLTAEDGDIRIRDIEWGRP